MQRLRRAADLGRNRCHCRPARWVLAPRDPEPSEPHRARTSGENLFVVLLVMAPSSQELEPPGKRGAVQGQLEPGELDEQLKQSSKFGRPIPARRVA